MLRDGTFDFLKPGDGSIPGMDGTLAPPSSSRRVNPRKLDQLLDQQRNWIFMTPEALKQQPTPEELFSVREEDWGIEAGRSSRVVEKYWNDQDLKSHPRNPRARSREANSSDTENSGSSNEDRERDRDPNGDDERPLDRPAGFDFQLDRESSKTASGGSASPWQNLFAQPGLAGGNGSGRQANEVFQDLFSKKEFGSSLFGSSGATLSDPSEAAKKHEQFSLEFQKLLAGPNPADAPRGLADPINFLSDSTRDEIHPVTAKTVETYSIGARGALGSSPFAPAGGGAVADRPVLGEGPGGSFFGQTFAPVAPVINQPARPAPMAPTFFDLPRRKF